MLEGPSEWKNNNPITLQEEITQVWVLRGLGLPLTTMAAFSSRGRSTTGTQLELAFVSIMEASDLLETQTHNCVSVHWLQDQSKTSKSGQQETAAKRA